MTDTFDSGADPADEGASGAQRPDATSQADEVTSTLAELESKLRELEQELSTMDSDQAEVPSPAVSVEAEPQASEPEIHFNPLLESTAAAEPGSEPQDFSFTPLSDSPSAAEPDPEPPEPQNFEPEISFSPLLESTAAEQPQEQAAAHSAPRLIDESLNRPASPSSTDPTMQAGADLPADDDSPTHEPVEQAHEGHEIPMSANEQDLLPTHEDHEIPMSANEQDLLPTHVELVGFRERLERFTRVITDEYNQLLSGLTSAGATHVSQPEIPELSRTEQPEATAYPEPSSEEPTFDGPVLDEPAVNDQTPIADTPEAQADALSHHPADPSFEIRESALRSEDAVDQLTGQAAEESDPDPVATPVAEERPSVSAEDELIFSGNVELAVGPFYDIASLSSFESELSGLANVADTSVRRFEASHAVIDLHLTAPIALVRELRAVAEIPFSARPIADNRLALTFDES